uniref:Uncharacterized protein n=1 Tax=Brassica oleracea var. oleracea TaxID=109376 RepID=A0A0D3CXK8_BRAOL
MARRHKTKPGATSQSDPLRSLPKSRATCWSDTPWSLGSSRPETPKSSILERPLRATYQGRPQPERPARATSSSRSRFDGARHDETRRERPPGSDYARLSEYLHSQCFDIPQNWFDNHYTTTFVLGALKTPNITG